MFLVDLRESMGQDLDVWKFSKRKIGVEHTPHLADALLSQTQLCKLVIFDTHIGAEGACVLAPALGRHPSLTSVDMGRNNIGDRGAKALAEALSQTSTLTNLKLNDNDIGDAGIQALAHALERNTRMLSLDVGVGRDSAALPKLKGLLARNNALAARTPSSESSNAALVDEIAALRTEVQRLNNRLRAEMARSPGDVDDAGARRYHRFHLVQENDALVEVNQQLRSQNESLQYQLQRSQATYYRHFPSTEAMFPTVSESWSGQEW
eukprot:TRINITY_DN14237_c0_g1_i1.p1 TRINITY_DN14237_c0_g1~~TRINITY_DN14237_c0_g1_i1.p1  ORF type:complete len:272 (+),score=18.09 TRINITY_DN14237_c0_g1_i1:23-817(+)